MMCSQALYTHQNIQHTLSCRISTVRATAATKLRESQVPHLPVVVEVDALELAEAHEVGAHQDAQLAPLLLALHLVARVALVLHAHPQLVHLGEVQVDEVDRVLNRARLRAGAVQRGHNSNVYTCTIELA